MFMCIDQTAANPLRSLGNKPKNTENYNTYVFFQYLCSMFELPSDQNPKLKTSPFLLI